MSTQSACVKEYYRLIIFYRGCDGSPARAIVTLHNTEAEARAEQNRCGKENGAEGFALDHFCVTTIDTFGPQSVSEID